MVRRGFRSCRVIWGTGVLLVLAAAPANAQQPERAPLRGPEVRTDRPPEMEDQFTQGRQRRGPMAAERVPMRAYLEALGRLRGENAPEEVRLSDAQEEKVSAIQAEFAEATRRFAAAARGQNQRRAAAPPPPPPPPPEERDAMREPMEDRARPDAARVEELRRNAPRPEDYQVKIWAVLNEPQRGAMTRELDRVKEELRQRREQQYMERQAAQRPPAAPGAGQIPVQRPAAERIRRLVDKLQQLPPDERERLLARLEEELDRRLGEGRIRRPARDDGSKPPPNMDEVPLPPPDRKP